MTDDSLFALATIGVSKVYTGASTPVQALKNITLKIRQGEFVAIMGPSGSGKTTLLNIMGLLDTPSSGELFIDQVNMTSVSDDERSHARARRIGFVFQTFNLIHHLTVHENVELPLLHSADDFSSMNEKTRKALAAVGLSGRFDHLPSELSGGEMQRVAIARAIINKPSLILADEPTGNLDGDTGAAILEIISELHNQGSTIALVTHDHDVASRAQRIVKIVDGTLIDEQ